MPTSNPRVTVERHGAVAVVTIANPPVNALSQAVRKQLLEAAEALDADATVSAVVLTASGATFVAGADVGEFDKPPQPPHLPDLVLRIEHATKPWIAAINGAALGGGLELALGCRYRFAERRATVGLPEVRLGLVPGAGGTVRVPRLAGFDAAVDLVTGGQPVSAQKANAMGLVDEVVESDVTAAAAAFAREASTRALPPRAHDRAAPAAPEDFWAEAERKIAARAKGEIAPLRALACIRRASEADFAAAMAFERETFLELRASAQAQALRHVFFAERAAPRPPWIAGVEPRPLRRAGVIGGGTMGAGIAAALREADIPVILLERDETALAKALANVRAIFEGAAKRGRITEDAARLRLSGVELTTDYTSLAGTDIVVEAVFEDLETKESVFATLERVCRTECVLATNTSYLDPNAIAAKLSDRSRFLALHFFSPANVMKLVEIIPIKETEPDVLATAFALARKLGKIPVQAGVTDGFIGNRILKVTRKQAERLLLTGATPAEVDAAMREFGMPMGPFEAQDLGGLDIAAYQRSAARARGETPFAPIADRLCALGRYGQKAGGGWYDYSAGGGRTPQSSPAVSGIIAAEAAARGLARRQRTSVEVALAIVLPMVNEGARILEEGIARDAADIDLVEIHGYGFPRWRGGLMHFASARGLAGVVAELNELQREGISDPPCHHLVRAAESGRFGGPM